MYGFYIDEDRRKARRAKWNTVRIISIGFFGVILLGSLLLWLPFSNHQPIRYIDALFTAVTILIKVDFPSPLAPTRPMCSPFKSRNDTSLKIARSPNPCVRCSTFNMLISLSNRILVSSLDFVFYFLFLMTLQPFHRTLCQTCHTDRADIFIKLYLRIVCRISSPLIRITC